MIEIVKKICCDQLHCSCVLIVPPGPACAACFHLGRAWLVQLKRAEPVVCGAECMGDNSHGSLQLTGSTILLIILIWLHNVMVIRTSQHHHLLTKWCTHGPAFHSIFRPGDEDDQQF